MTLNMYAGIIKQGTVISVFAENEITAQRNIYDQLDRPGRKTLLKKWVEQGCQVKPRFKR